ncbi:prephenate dehydratase domain-containing protein [Streptomyces sp. NEAU-H3]|uniref:prephenate dehydratase domain-containing protein n=1 Tax=Streptomyces sp. NEAU-H3 TaxID=2720636 RepID=UPI0014391F0B|nr:prephenate dehydratase domain-containing protein [Streptomyces sp. NEAU-H3]NJA55571.1 prephenate dehydratase [Streptomyces sp. NEAU-H3]
MSSVSAVAYQGEPGSNSAAVSAAMFPGVPTLPCATFADVLHAVNEGEARVALIPIETSTSWVRATPRHALGQCRRITREHGWTARVAEDTAGAAREVAELGDPAHAAFAPPAAADLYGLRVLAEQVEDEHHNTTRFLALARADETPRPERVEGVAYVTSLLFRTRNIPASLYKALGAFASNGVNLTKIESYQLGGSFYASQFYVDVEGHPEDPGFVRALEELSFFSAELRELGVYPAHTFREELHRPAETPSGPSAGTLRPEAGGE